MPRRGDPVSEASPSFEALLYEALAPVEPPEDLVLRLEDTLLSITELAADELEAWELSAMRDPRNWVRPAVAVVAGTAAGGALVLLRARRRAQVAETLTGGRWSVLDRSAGRAVRDISAHTRKLLGDR
jgi:hypothetical protein